MIELYFTWISFCVLVVHLSRVVAELTILWRDRMMMAKPKPFSQKLGRWEGVWILPVESISLLSTVS